MLCALYHKEIIRGKCVECKTFVGWMGLVLAVVDIYIPSCFDLVIIKNFGWTNAALHKLVFKSVPLNL